MSNTYCPLPWKSLHSHANEITPCCMWKGRGTRDFLDPLNSKFFNEVRQSMIDNVPLSGCEQCYTTEAAGKESRRQRSIKLHGVVQTVELTGLDLSFDNVCNLKCRGCMSGSSHLLYNDEIEIYGKPLIGEKFWETELKFDLSSITDISISGGEPMLSKNFEKFAGDIIAANRADCVNLDINTNATVLPSSNIEKLMLNAKSLSMQLSIDGLYGLQEYFRSKSNFADILENLKYYQELIKKRKNKITLVAIHTTVSVYNVNKLLEIKEFFARNYSEFLLTHRVLYWPQQLSICFLPKDYKELLLKMYSKASTEYNDVVTELKNDNENFFEHFLNYHDKLNKLRNESLNKNNILLSDYIDSYPRKYIDSTEFFSKQASYVES